MPAVPARQATLTEPLSMPRPSRRGALPTAALPALLLLAPLAGCGGDDKQPQFAPACPQAGIVRDAADLSRYGSGGRDLTDLVLDGRVTGVRGSCAPGDTKDTVKTTLQVVIELTRGPAARGRAAEAGYFVAVVDGERILDKRTFNLRAEFPANTDRIRLSGDEVELTLPVSATKTAAAYRVLVGFQLQPAELALNRQRGPR